MDIDYGIEEKDSDILFIFNMVQHRKQRYTVDYLKVKNENITNHKREIYHTNKKYFNYPLTAIIT